MNVENLYTYCGVSCSTCARYYENMLLVKLAKALAELVDAHGFQEWMPAEVREFDYKEFRKGLAFLADKKSWLVCRKTCKEGAGRPDCEIRRCCEARGLSLCFECEDFPCEKVVGNEELMKRAKSFMELGKKAWLNLLSRKIERNYEHHTGKSYEIKITKSREQNKFK